MSESEITSTTGEYEVGFKDKELDSVNAKSVKMKHCTAQSITAEKVTMDQSAAIFVAAEKIESKNSATLLMVAQEVHGDIQPIFSLPAALVIAGAVIFGAILLKRN